MQLRNSRESYGAVAQFLHWSMAAVVLIAWVSGGFGDDLPRPLRIAGLSVHIGAGCTVLALVAIRIVWRMVDPLPPPEKTVFAKWTARAGTLVHYALYGLIIVTPVVGIGVQFSRGDSLSVFGMIEIPSPWLADRDFSHALKEIHEFLANSLMILAGIHAAAALIHHWIIRDRTLLRMLPWSS